MSVDLLLDASTSQEERTELVARQAYILAESLSALKLPVRVWGYLSMSGYTVLTRYRDYEEHEKNEEIFRYSRRAQTGTGLAYRAVGELMAEYPSERKIPDCAERCDAERYGEVSLSRAGTGLRGRRGR